MTETETLILYTRPGCHLCELAASLLQDLACDWLIPVVNSESTKKELPFPFGEEQLSRFQEEIS